MFYLKYFPKYITMILLILSNKSIDQGLKISYFHWKLNINIIIDIIVNYIIYMLYIINIFNINIFMFII